MDYELAASRLHRRLGHREHPRGDLGRDEAQGGLRHHRPAHDGALLRRLGLYRRRTRTAAQPGLRRLREGRADGRRPAAPRPAARRRASWSTRSGTRSAPTSTASRSSRAGWTPHGATHEKVYDVAWSRRPRAGRRRQAAARRQHGRRRQRHLDQHDRRLRADRGLDRPGLRPGAVAPSTTRACMEIPTPRWTAYDAFRFGVADAAEGAETTARNAPTPRRSGIRPLDDGFRPDRGNVVDRSFGHGGLLGTRLTGFPVSAVPGAGENPEDVPSAGAGGGFDLGRAMT